LALRGAEQGDAGDDVAVAGQELGEDCVRVEVGVQAAEVSVWRRRRLKVVRRSMEPR
jgi:hypothetical protein